MSKDRFSFSHHRPVPDALWDRFAKGKVDNEGFIRTMPKEKAHYGRELCAVGSLVRFWEVRFWDVADHSEASRRESLSAPCLLFEWVEFVHKDLMNVNNDVADGYGCMLFARVSFYGEMCWVYLNLALYDYEAL